MGTNSLKMYFLIIVKYVIIVEIQKNRRKNVYNSLHQRKLPLMVKSQGRMMKEFCPGEH